MVSYRPREARKRIRKANIESPNKVTPEMIRDIEIIYNKPITEWDWEELSKGRVKGPDGKFAPGASNKAIMPIVTEEAKRRMRDLTEYQVLALGNQAVEMLKKLMENNEYDDWGKPVVPPSVKLQAATYALNHIIGTAAKREETGGQDKLLELMGGVLVNPDGRASHDNEIIDGEIVEDEDEDGGD